MDLLGTEWRVIREGASTGAWNMAVDEALLRCHGRGESPPTLRFYRWDPACLSLGYFQKVDRQVDMEACQEAGVDVIRRPTGGRAVLHDREVTYSVVIKSSLLPGTVEETYLALSRGLAGGLRSLGVPVDITPSSRAQAATAACFDAPSSYELAVNGRKLVGSAQCRAHGAILQHGSVLLKFEPLRLSSLLRFSSPEARKRAAAMLERQAVGVNQTGVGVLSYGQVVQGLEEGLASSLGLDLVEGELSPKERDLAVRLMEEKYSSDSWNRRR